MMIVKATKLWNVVIFYYSLLYNQRWAKWWSPTFDIHIPLPSTQQVADTAFVFKKGRIGRLMLTTLDLWEGRGRRRDFFYTFVLLPENLHTYFELSAQAWILYKAQQWNTRYPNSCPERIKLEMHWGCGPRPLLRSWFREDGLRGQNLNMVLIITTIIAIIQYHFSIYNFPIIRQQLNRLLNALQTY
jgi:hypothetical protein